MTENKYFTPEISDIRVGYECETRAYPYPEWVKSVITDGEEIQFIIDNEWEIKIPFLTKEQIEAEGWKLNDDKLLTLDNKPLSSFSKNIYGLMFNSYNCEIQIYDKKREIYVYQGECKCINTFRFLNKLFNI